MKNSAKPTTVGEFPLVLTATVINRRPLPLYELNAGALTSVSWSKRACIDDVTLSCPVYILIALPGCSGDGRKKLLLITAARSALDPVPCPTSMYPRSLDLPGSHPTSPEHDPPGLFRCPPGAQRSVYSIPCVNPKL